MSHDSEKDILHVSGRPYDGAGGRELRRLAGPNVRRNPGPGRFRQPLRLSFQPGGEVHHEHDQERLHQNIQLGVPGETAGEGLLGE